MASSNVVSAGIAIVVSSVISIVVSSVISIVVSSGIVVVVRSGRLTGSERADCVGVSSLAALESRSNHK